MDVGFRDITNERESHGKDDVHKIGTWELTRWIPNILHDLIYIIPGKFWYDSVLGPCRILTQLSTVLNVFTELQTLNPKPFSGLGLEASRLVGRSSLTARPNSIVGSSALRRPRSGATSSRSRHSRKRRGSVARLMNLTYPYGYPCEPNSPLLDLSMLLNLTLPYVLWIFFCTLLFLMCCFDLTPGEGRAEAYLLKSRGSGKQTAEANALQVFLGHSSQVSAKYYHLETTEALSSKLHEAYNAEI